MIEYDVLWKWKSEKTMLENINILENISRMLTLFNKITKEKKISNSCWRKWASTRDGKCNLQINTRYSGWHCIIICEVNESNSIPRDLGLCLKSHFKRYPVSEYLFSWQTILNFSRTLNFDQVRLKIVY